jgi:AraC family transcriptional regulator of adaptative response / DNA-3-methyladenine glycosylase II
MNPMRLRRSAVAKPSATGRRSSVGSSPAETVDAPAVSVLLGYRPPFDQAALLAFVAQRAIPGIEAVAGNVIRRSVRAGALGPEAGWLEASFVADAARVRVSFAPALGPSCGAVIAAVRRWLDLDAAPDTIDSGLAGLPGAPGLRLPGSIDPFELAVRAVLGQQVTVAAARTLARRLVERFGSAIATPWDAIARAFPDPATLAGAPLERIAELGIIRSRAGAIQAIAAAWPELVRLFAPGASPERLVACLRELPGIGPWTAHYIAMRGLGWPDAFPPGDVAAMKAMHERFGTATPRACDAHAEAWRPWRAYALLRLWNSPVSVAPGLTP